MVGGRFDIESTPGRGTTIRAEIPKEDSTLRKAAGRSIKMKRIKVLLAEDHTMVREGLRLLLEAEGDIEVLCEAETGRMAVTLALRHRPDVVLMDIAMPQLNGLEAARQILQTLPDARILILSAHEDDAYLEQALATGVAGYLIKQTSASMLTKAIRAIASGKTFFSPSISLRLSQYEKK